MVGPVGGFAPVGGGVSPLSPAAPAGGAARPAGVEDMGPQGPEELSTPAGKALAGESGFDGFKAVEEAGKAAGSAQGGLMQAEEAAYDVGHVGNGPLVDEKSNSLFAGLRVVPGCSACMGVPGPHTH